MQEAESLMDERSQRSKVSESSSLTFSLSNPLLYVVIVLLLIAVLLLPPISLVTRLQERGYTRIGPGAAEMAHPDGLTLALKGASEMAVKVNAIPRQAVQEAQAGDGWSRALQALPDTLTLVSPIYEIAARGSADSGVQVRVALPKDVTAVQTLDLYTWDGAAWRWLPGHVDQATGVIVSDAEQVPANLAIMQVSAPGAVAAAEASADQPLTEGAEATLTEIYPAGLRLTADGALQGQVEDIAWTGKANLLPIVRNYGPGTTGDALTAVLTDPAARQRHVAALAQAAIGYTGLVLDYQGLDPSLRAAFTDLVREVANALHAQGFQLGVVVGPATRSGTAWDTGGYDWRALGAVADFLLIPGPDDPTAYDVDGPASALIAWAVGEVNRARIMLLVSAASVEQIGSAFVPLSDDVALRAFGQVAAEATQGQVIAGTPLPVVIQSTAKEFAFDEAAMTYRYVTDSGGQPRTVWLSTPSALAQRLRWAGVYALRGVALRDLLRQPGASERVAAVATLLKSAQMPGAQAPAVVWTIRDPSGRVITQTTTLDQTRLEVVAELPGVYSIEASVGDAPLGHVSVEVAAQPTATPQATATPTGTATYTPSPTNTPRPTNTPGPSPTPGPTNTPGPTQAAPPPPPPSGGGAFQLGGHVDSFAYPDQMRYAGMWWVKRQVRYRLGDDPSNVAWMIDQAHNLGFKILLGIVGHADQMGASDYFDQYASYVAGVAARGADAIEVWNEMNLDREWPNGQINPASYVELLRRAYTAIKNANPGTLVISGALSPTGYFGGCFPHGCDDAPYLAGMVAAGFTRYADCVGIHYNEGILPPDATSGDPRGNSSFYTRYYWGMVNTYWNIIGGARRLCFTELGYLTDEGYDPPLEVIAPGFAWARDVTVQQQAEWLARAAQLSRDSGKVRIMIIWNVDFTYYGSDPMAGYAIFRPGGGCPACETLHNVLGGR